MATYLPFDPRGMTLVNNTFWSDIYFAGRDAYNGSGVPSSKYNVVIADDNRPFVPADWVEMALPGLLDNCNWWTATEIATSFQKRLPNGQELRTLAFGTTNEISTGADPINTGVNGSGFTNSWEKFTSKWGVIQSTGVMWTWGPEWVLASVTSTAGYKDLYPSINRGQINEPANSSSRALLRGASWGNGAEAGVFTASLNLGPSAPATSLGFRCVASHSILP